MAEPRLQGSGSVPAHRPEYGDTPGWAVPTADPRLPRCGKCTPCRRTIAGSPAPCVLWRAPAPTYVPTRQVNRPTLPELARSLEEALRRA